MSYLTAVWECSERFAPRTARFHKVLTAAVGAVDRHGGPRSISTGSIPVLLLLPVQHDSTSTAGASAGGVYASNGTGQAPEKASNMFGMYTQTAVLLLLLYISPVVGCPSPVHPAAAAVLLMDFSVYSSMINQVLPPHTAAVSTSTTFYIIDWYISYIRVHCLLSVTVCHCCVSSHMR